jgi:hypothetical protein
MSDVAAMKCHHIMQTVFVFPDWRPDTIPANFRSSHENSENQSAVKAIRAKRQKIMPLDYCVYVPFQVLLDYDEFTLRIVTFLFLRHHQSWPPSERVRSSEGEIMCHAVTLSLNQTTTRMPGGKKSGSRLKLL